MSNRGYVDDVIYFAGDFAGSVCHDVTWLLS